VFQKIDQLNIEIWENATNGPAGLIKKAEEAFDLSVSENYPLGQAESLLNLGRCLIFTSNYRKAKDKLEDALSLFRTLSDERADTGALRTLNALGVACYELEEYENALNYYFMVLTESEVSKNDQIRILTLNNIGEIYRLLHSFEEALSYYHRALQLAESLKDLKSIGVTNINLGEIYLSLKDFEEAEQYFVRTLAIAEENNFLQLKADAILGSAKILSINEDHFAAESKLKAASAIYLEISDILSIAECNYQLGVIGLNNRKFEDAKEYLRKAEETAAELTHSGLLSRCKRKLAEIFKFEEDYKLAMEYLEEAYRLEAVFMNHSLQNRLKKISILYRTEQTETEKEAYRMQSLALEKSNREIKFINEIGREITSTFNLEEIIFNTYQMLHDILDISSFSVALYDEDNNQIKFTNIVENGERLEPFVISADSSTSMAAWTIKNRKPILTNRREDALKYVSDWGPGPGETVNSAIFMPMLQGNRKIGCMTIQNTKKDVYSESDLDTIGAVSTFLAIALDNSRIHSEVNQLNEAISSEKRGLEVAYQKIAHMANHDSLTNLPNRHLLREFAKRGINLAKRDNTRLALLYMDLDRFKPINDTLGHESGDLVLKIVADRLTNTLRNSDTIARIGGDEFIIVLHNVDTDEGVLAVAEKIISAIGKNLLLKERTFQIGASIGIATFPDDDETLEGLMIKADKAMYRAKQTGRNRAVFFSQK